MNIFEASLVEIFGLSRKQQLKEVQSTMADLPKKIDAMKNHLEQGTIQLEDMEWEDELVPGAKGEA